jgi:hypothetical protein
MRPKKMPSVCFVLISTVVLVALGLSFAPCSPSVSGHSSTISPGDLKDIWGGADEKCWQSRNQCSSGTSTHCFVPPYIDPDPSPEPCALSYQEVFNTNEYFECEMREGDNDEHCGTPTGVFCSETRDCLAHVTRGPLFYYPFYPAGPYCANDPTNDENCASCSSGPMGYPGAPQPSQICVPD